MAKFSKAHYNLLSQAIVKAKPYFTTGPEQVVVERIALSIGKALEKDNSAFSITQWMNDVMGRKYKHVAD